MNCLVVAATANEISPFLEKYRTIKKISVSMDIDILITGIGLTATTYSLVKQLSIKRPDLIIQAGVAGCFTTTIPLGTVVAIKQDTIADEGVVEQKKLRTIFDLKLMPQNQFPFSKGWLINPAGELIKKIKLKAVKGISVNEITTSKQVIQFYKDKFHPATESMEGSALHYVCLMEKIPFLQIRSISNYIGERKKKKWNLNDSIHNLNQELIRIVAEL
ncbi:MAG: futalosine hydrolase [Chitinophagaceae bacterium]|nr:futalosine hydrolase [Chitinophagaceae bacterium]